MPPMLEHLASLMSANNAGLDLQTFKMVDQLSGRTLGLRIDTTPQVARIDAHLLNRAGVTRLCYCGPVLHTKPLGPYATREPLQLGAEIYGHAGLEADLEILQLTLQCLRASHLASFHIDLSDARILPALLKGQSLSADQTKVITDALTHKDISAMRELTAQLPQALGQALQALVQMYGDLSVLQTARDQFATWPEVLTALDQLAWLASHIDHPVSIDLADLRGYAYYSGPRFSVFVPESSDAFSLDIKALVGLLPYPQPQAAIRAPWRDDAVLVATIAQLRAQGHTVVCMLPGHDSEVDEFECDRELVDTSGGWTVQPLRQQ
jgi:ATP phosphoribosyltransferase regulatory subunit